MEFPRYVGNPHQYRVTTKQELLDFIQANNEKRDCYWSHNAMPTKDTITVRTLPFDFDDKVPVGGDGKPLREPDPANCHADMASLAVVAAEVGVDTLSVFSGRKGFHTYLCFRPTWAENNNGLKEWYKAVQLYFVEKAKLKTWDHQLLGDTRRILRIPGTQHPKSKLWCCIIDPTWDMKRILEHAGQPKHFTPDRFPEGRETLLQFIKRMGIKREAAYTTSFEGTALAPYRGTKNDFDAYVMMVLPRKCIHNALMTTNPPHPVRREAVTTMHDLGYDLMFVKDFMRKVSERYQWTNRDPEQQNYHIDDLWRRQGYRPHHCRTLRASGLCIGAACEVFTSKFPEG